MITKGSGRMVRARQSGIEAQNGIRNRAGTTPWMVLGLLVAGCSTRAAVGIEADGGSTADGGGDGRSRVQFLVLPSMMVPVATNDYWSMVTDASDDGSVVVGRLSHFDSAGGEGVDTVFTWSAEAGGRTLEGALPSGYLTLPHEECIPGPARGACPDGRQIGKNGRGIFGRAVGPASTSTPGDLSSFRFFRWNAEGGYSLFGPSNVTDGQIDFIAADGTSAIGLFSVDPERASYATFRWSESGGFTRVADLPGWPKDREPVAMSHDGKVLLAGDYVWFESLGAERIEPLSPQVPSCAGQVLSGDGTVVYGSCVDAGAGPASGVQWFRWTRDSGTTSIGDCIVNETTDDGAAVVGYDGRVVTRWTTNDGCTVSAAPDELLRDGGHLVIMAHGLSDDGRVVYGQIAAGDESGTEAVRWSVDDGFVKLSPLPGHTVSSAMAGSRDGSVQAGYSALGLPPDGKAVIWDAGGVRDVTAELLAAGADLQGLHLTQAWYVWSGPRITVLGVGRTAENQERAWIAWLPTR